MGRQNEGSPVTSRVVRGGLHACGGVHGTSRLQSCLTREVLIIGMISRNYGVPCMNETLSKEGKVTCLTRLVNGLSARPNMLINPGRSDLLADRAFSCRSYHPPILAVSFTYEIPLLTALRLDTTHWIVRCGPRRRYRNRSLKLGRA